MSSLLSESGQLQPTGLAVPEKSGPGIFQDRVALITGAASGIGRALARHLGQAGARLGLVDRDQVGLQQFQQELAGSGISCQTAVADVRQRDLLHQGLESLTKKLGPADLLFPCAGICAFHGVDNLNVPQVEEILQVNYLGVIYSIEAVLPSMLERRSGRIVCIASLAAFRGIPFEAAYCGSKAALVAYLESLRPALRRRGIIVTTIFPGFVQTPLLQGLMSSGQTQAPPGVIDVDTAALKILAAVRRGRRTASFPFSTSFLVWWSRLLPHWLYDSIMTRMARRINLPY